MWWRSNINERLHECKHYGFDLQAPPKFSWSEVKKRRDANILRLNGIYASNLKNSDVTVYGDDASFVRRDADWYVLKVGVDEVLAKHVLIAVGGKPSTLGVTGEELCIDSDDFFDLEAQPKKVAVVGAGYIAVELAGVFNGLGTETHLFVRGDTALRKFDEMLRVELHKRMIADGINIHPGSNPKSFHKNAANNSISLTLSNGQTFDGFDQVLVAIGRVPEVTRLNANAIGLELDPKTQHIVVDDLQNTSCTNVFALGDVCGKIELTPMAIAAGRRLADRVFGDTPSSKADYSLVPTVVFSHPPIGTIGLTEQDARTTFGDDNVKVYKNVGVNLYYNVFDIPPETKPRTYMKMICLKNENERIVGLHILGMAADEMLQGFGIAMKMGATKSDFDSCVAIHPSAAEEMVTLAPWGLSEHPKPTYKSQI